VNDTLLTDKLRDAPIGVVNEEVEVAAEFGFAEDRDWDSRDEIDVTDNSHYITSPFSTGLLTLYTALEPVHMLNAPYSTDLITLAETFIVGTFWKPSLAVLNTGDAMVSGGTAPARRVQLPWGADTFNFASLNADGKTIMKRAIEWAGGAGDAAGTLGTLCFSTNSDVSAGGHTPGIDTWQSAELLELSGSTAYEPGGTAGSIASKFDLNVHASSDEALGAAHIVSQAVSVGDFLLQAGDLLVVTASAGTIGGISVSDEDVLVFRPSTPGDYSSGSWSLLLDSSDFGIGDDVQALTLVEVGQTVGGVALNSGDILVANNDMDVLRVQVTTTGSSSAATSSLFIDASDLGVSVGNRTVGIHFVSDAAQLGDVLLTQGTILWTLTNDEIGGISGITEDVLPHDVVALTLTGAGAITVGSAVMFLDGSQIGLNTDAEEIHSIAVEPTTLSGGGGGSPEMFVNDIAMSGRTSPSKNCWGQANIWITDEDGANVEGATVTVEWSGAVSGTMQGVTDADGKTLRESLGVKNGGVFTCTVTDVVKSGYTYNPSLNVETSDSIKVTLLEIVPIDPVAL
jgi:hypothetical protein